jgi:hypothetical protein
MIGWYEAKVGVASDSSLQINLFASASNYGACATLIQDTPSASGRVLQYVATLNFWYSFNSVHGSNRNNNGMQNLKTMYVLENAKNAKLNGS